MSGTISLCCSRTTRVAVDMVAEECCELEIEVRVLVPLFSRTSADWRLRLGCAPYGMETGLVGS